MTATRQQIEALGWHDPLIRVAVHRAHADGPPIFAKEEDKWVNVLQDLVAQMVARNEAQRDELMRYMHRYGALPPTQTDGE